MSQNLAVWLNGFKIGELEERRRRLRFTYADAALATYPLNTPLLSVAMPTRYEPYGDPIARPFFEGLLPEGRLREVIAYDLQVNPLDSFTLLRLLARDCAGAVSVLPPDEQPDVELPPRLEPLDSAAMISVLAALPNAPLGTDWAHKITLAGQQEKLLLSRLVDGRWSRPGPGLPSTHILKPANSSFPASVYNEAFSLRLASYLGLPTAAVEIATIGDQPVLVVARFDREYDSTGRIQRLHQEDLGQALSLRIPFGQARTPKYEQWGGPSLSTVAAVLDRWARRDDVHHLIRLATINVVLGNSDNHAKNLALLHPRRDQIELAPAYDLMATSFYPRPGARPEVTVSGIRYGSAYSDGVSGMYVNGETDTNAITSADLVAEAVSWGMSRTDAATIVTTTIEQTPAAIAAAAAELPAVPAELITLIESRAKRLAQRLGGSIAT